MATQEPGSIKELRDAADRGKKASQELDAMKREMAFLKAGVDTDTKVGQLLYKAYEGDLETDAIRAEWSELAPAAAAPPPYRQGSRRCCPCQSGSRSRRKRAAFSA